MFYLHRPLKLYFGRNTIELKVTIFQHQCQGGVLTTESPATFVIWEGVFFEISEFIFSNQFQEKCIFF